MIRKLFAFGLAVVLALMPVQTFGKTVSITNVSYDPTREMFEQYNKIYLMIRADNFFIVHYLSEISICS